MPSIKKDDQTKTTDSQTIKAEDKNPPEVPVVPQTEQPPVQSDIQYEYLNIDEKKIVTKKLYLIYFLVTGGLVLLVGLFYAAFQFRQLAQVSIQPTKTAPPFPTSSPSAVPVTTISKEDLKMQVLNGSGISGQAAQIKDLLSKAGFNNIDIGNFPGETIADTTATFSARVSKETKKDIVTTLETVFPSIMPDEASSETTYDVVITTGSKTQ